MPDCSFCENAERIAEDAYIPTVRDVLHARARTIGIKEITFTSKDYLWKYVKFLFFFFFNKKQELKLRF